MRITIEELLACPKGMSIEEYHLLLEKRKRLQKVKAEIKRLQTNL